MRGERQRDAVKIAAIAGEAGQAQNRPSRQGTAAISPDIEKQIIVAPVIDVLSVRDRFAFTQTLQNIHGVSSKFALPETSSNSGSFPGRPRCKSSAI